jgi:eukaryotic-like serine/threonine-protein kinase
VRGELQVGATLAGYRIDGFIGRGGMGVVYRATQVALGRTVALKVLAPELAESTDFRDRFKREARIAASIDDPNVVALYQADEADGRLFLAMQFVDGSDLREIISAEKSGVNPLRAAHIINQVGNALEAAHSRGLVHRDVKPGNILIAQLRGNDHAYLTDFGLTRQVSSDSGLTKAGQFVGTLGYVAPEQITGTGIGARTDVYALGCVLFETLTGRVPFDGETDVATMYAHLNEPPPAPSQLVRSLSKDFDLIVSQAMAKDATQRTASAAAVGAAAVAAARGDHQLVTECLGLSSTHGRPGPSVAAAPALPTPSPAQQQPTRSARYPHGASQARPAQSTGRRRRLHRAGPRRAGPLSSAANVWGGEPPTVRIPLAPGFQYSHGPLDEEGAIPLLGNDHLVEALRDRLAHSHGGSFLLTGFRGVGKTTVVDRALSRLLVGDDDRFLLHVRVDIAAPKNPSELLFDLVRGLYDCIDDQLRQGRFGGLEPEVERRLLRAYRRTSAELSESREETLDRTGGASLSVPAGPVRAKAERTVKSSVQSRDQEVFGLYTVPAAESDFRWLAAHLYGNSVPPERARPRRWMRWRESSSLEARRLRGQVVVVLDEIDKLTELPNGQRAIRALVTGLKNLLTTRDVHFVFVAGPDLHDAVAADRNRGNSVFDSVFSWQEYVPCLWGVEDRLLDAVITDPDARRSDEVELLRGHLAFCGRGLPRDMLRELNSLVDYDGTAHHLALTPAALEQMEFFSGLQQCVQEFVDSHEGAERRELEIDKWRLGVYYAVEWILRFEASFRLGDVMKLGPDHGMDRLFALSRGEVTDLLDHLEENGLLRQVGGPAAAQPVFDEVPEEELTTYEVIPNVETALRDYARVFESEEEPIAAPADEAILAGYVGQSLADGRYTLLEELDRSGTGRVYRASDRDSGDEVAVKLFEGLVRPGDSEMRERFEREGRIALGLRHPHIVATRATFSEPDGRLAIVMDLVPGVAIAQRLEWGTLSPRETVAVGSRVLEALDYLAAKEVARLDLRPSSIMVDESLSPIIVNLGLAKNVGSSDEPGPTRIGAVVGTPRYAAPEQLSGEAVDIRADLYSLALILFEMLVGRPAREGESVAAVIRAAREESIDVSGVPGSAAFRSALANALDRDPEARYATPAAMRAALLSVPEGIALAAAEEG